MAYLITCPHCGPRTSDEFYIKGDASKARPSGGVEAGLDAWHDYVHLRDNVRGPIAEYWHHTGGCRQWLVVERDSMSHEIHGVTTAGDWLRSLAPKAAARKRGRK